MTLLLPAERLCLRPYQAEAVDAARSAWAEGIEGALIVFCTGGGKTVTALSLVAEALGRGERVVWLAHRDELISQPMEALRRFWPDLMDQAGRVQASSNQVDAQVVFASVRTLQSAGRTEALLQHGAVDLLVVDECHNAPAKGFTQVIDTLKAGRKLGLSATPEREDGADLSETWEIVYAYGIVEGIREGFLIPPYAAVDRLKVDLDPGSEDMEEAGRKLLLAGIVEHTVEALGKPHKATRLPWRDDRLILSARGRSALVFTATVEQARLTAEALTAAGRTARWICGTTPKRDRRRLIAAFRNGHIDTLCNAAVLTEGTDLPRADCIVLCRPCRSRVLYVQIVGRGLRLHETQSECLVIDLAGATEVHSLVAAPVLVGESQCPDSPNRVHVFVEDEGQAVCEYCDKKLACWPALEAGRLDGRHVWTDKGECDHCGRPRCPESPHKQHERIPEAAEGKFGRRCIWCDVLVSDPLGSMVKARRSDKPVPACWVRLFALEPEVWACDLGNFGILFMRVDSRPDGYQPIWLPKHKRIPRMLGGPYDRQHSVAVAADLLRQVRARWDPRRQAAVPGGMSEAQRPEWARRATQRATRSGVAVRAGSKG